MQPSGAENNELTRILCTTVGPVALLMLKKGLCSTVQPNMVTQPTFSDDGKAQARLLYNFLKSLSSINNLRKNKWDVIIITRQLLCTKHVSSLKNILFLEFENFNFITCCARNILLDFNVIQLYFEIIFNLTRNFG